MIDGESLYAILGVERSVDAAALKARWRELAKELHPDRAGSRGLPPEQAKANTSRLQRINAAYTVLSDAARRKEYDRELDAIRAEFTRQKRASEREQRRAKRSDFKGVNIEEAAFLLHRKAKAKRLAQLTARAQEEQDQKRTEQSAVAELTAKILAEVLLAQVLSNLEE